MGAGRLERPVPKGADLQSARLPITGYAPEYEEKKHVAERPDSNGNHPTKLSVLTN